MWEISVFEGWTKKQDSLKESEKKQRIGRQLREWCPGSLGEGGEILEEMRSIHLTNRKPL